MSDQQSAPAATAEEKRIVVDQLANQTTTARDSMIQFMNERELREVLDSAIVMICELESESRELRHGIDGWQRTAAAHQDAAGNWQRHAAARDCVVDVLISIKKMLRIPEGIATQERISELLAALREAVSVVEGRAARSPFVAVDDWKRLLEGSR